MSISFTPKRPNIAKIHAFTLVEIIVVVAIIGIFVSASVFYFTPSPDNVQKQANRLQTVFQYAKERALLRTEQLAITFSLEGYQFYRYYEKKWIAIDDSPLNPHKLGDGIELELAIEQSQVTLPTKQSKHHPQVLILSNGENTAFSMTLKGLQSVAVMTVNILGEIDIIIEE